VAKQIIIYGLAILVAIIVLAGLLLHFFVWLYAFMRELRTINIEIGRTEGEDKRHWIRRKRRLWLSIIPFVRY